MCRLFFDWFEPVALVFGVVVVVVVGIWGSQIPDPDKLIVNHVSHMFLRNILLNFLTWQLRYTKCYNKSIRGTGSKLKVTTARAIVNREDVNTRPLRHRRQE